MRYIDDIISEHALERLDSALNTIEDSEEFRMGVYSFINGEEDAELFIEYIRRYPDASRDEILNLCLDLAEERGDSPYEAEFEET